MFRSSPTAAVIALACLAGVAGAADQETEYTVTFDATWSAETHPDDFPSSSHWSGLIGGTHDGGVVFWQPGAIASDGIEAMAETGSKSYLQSEVQAAITSGFAEFLLSGGNIPGSPGQVSLTFAITQDYPLVSLVSMIAPSPDWFVGVHDLSLFEGGEWIESLVVELYAHDAGTDSGTTYTSPNQNTEPASPISLLTSCGFTESGLAGTFTFTRNAAVGVDPAAAPGLIVLAPVRPNPSAGATSVTFELPDAMRVVLDVFDASGRRVRDLAGGLLEAGTHTITWDGVLSSGRRAPSGVYLVRLSAGSDARVQRIVITR